MASTTPRILTLPYEMIAEISSNLWLPDLANFANSHERFLGPSSKRLKRHEALQAKYQSVEEKTGYGIDLSRLLIDIVLQPETAYYLEEIKGPHSTTQEAELRDDDLIAFPADRVKLTRQERTKIRTACNTPLFVAVFEEHLAAMIPGTKRYGMVRRKDLTMLILACLAPNLKHISLYFDPDSFFHDYPFCTHFEVMLSEIAHQRATNLADRPPLAKLEKITLTDANCRCCFKLMCHANETRPKLRYYPDPADSLFLDFMRNSREGSSVEGIYTQRTHGLVHYQGPEPDAYPMLPSSIQTIELRDLELPHRDLAILASHAPGPLTILNCRSAPLAKDDHNTYFATGPYYPKFYSIQKTEGSSKDLWVAKTKEKHEAGMVKRFPMPHDW